MPASAVNPSLGGVFDPSREYDFQNSVESAKKILSYGSATLGGIGYGTGAGGSITQATSKSTGVTLNALSGAITMHNATLNDATTVGFVVTNSAVAAADNVVLSIKSGATVNSYIATVGAVSAGSFRVEVRNISGGNLGEAIVLVFTVLKGSTA